MNFSRFALVGLAGTVLLGASNPSLASGYGSCEVEAIVICNSGLVPDEDTVAAELKFRISGKPACRGLGTGSIEEGRKFTVPVRVPAEINAEAVKPGSRVHLKYDYFEGLTPDGLQSRESWSLVSAEQPNRYRGH